MFAGFFCRAALVKTWNRHAYHVLLWYLSITTESNRPSSVQNIWKARCVEQWNVPVTAASCAWRALHIDLVHCLSLIDGTAEGCSGCYDNVLAIVDVLDAYRTLAEMTRACFGRLGQLLEGDEAREAVKVVDWRIMDHALWALKAYPDDVDLLLVRRALRSYCCSALARPGAGRH